MPLITDGQAIADDIAACLAQDPCLSILCDCCCEVCDEPCANCDPTDFAPWGNVSISGDVTITDMGADFSYQGDFHCECFWVWNDGAGAVLTIFYEDSPKEWCAVFENDAVYSSQNCSCTSELEPGVIPDLCCTGGELIGSFTLPKVGGGSGVTVTLS